MHLKTYVLIFVLLAANVLGYMNASDYLQYKEIEDRMQKDPESLVTEYCDAVNIRVIWIVGIAFLMWLGEPKFKQKFKDNPYLIKLYKWLGLGILFMAGFAIYYMR